MGCELPSAKSAVISALGISRQPGAAGCQRFLCFWPDQRLSLAGLPRPTVRSPCPASADPLDDLRRQIDEIDDALHDLLMRRADVVAPGRRGQGQGARRRRLLRPGREAVILRRLVARHHGPLPPAALVRLWREMIAATCCACRARSSSPSMRRTTRPALLGSGPRIISARHTPLTAIETVGQVLRAVMRTARPPCGVLPMPAGGRPRALVAAVCAATSRARPAVFARLPFGDRGSIRRPEVEALAIGRVVPETTGDDRSLLVLEAVPELSRSAAARH